MYATSALERSRPFCLPVTISLSICIVTSVASAPWALIPSQKHEVMKTWVLSALNHSAEVITPHKILTSGTSLWRKIGSSSCEFPLGISVCINGAIPFLMLDLMSNKIMKVFDVRIEKFRMIRFLNGALNQAHRPAVDTIQRPFDSVRLSILRMETSCWRMH